MALKELIVEKHRQAEQHPFNQKLVQGQLNEREYATYLIQMNKVYTTIEQQIQLPLHLHRAHYITLDIEELLGTLETPIHTTVLPSTDKYTSYLDSRYEKDILPHVYLNYMALMYGGELIKKVIPGTGRIYQFQEKQDLITYIRTKQKDEWADEVNKGFDYLIQVYDELHRLP